MQESDDQHVRDSSSADGNADAGSDERNCVNDAAQTLEAANGEIEADRQRLVGELADSRALLRQTEQSLMLTRRRLTDLLRARNSGKERKVAEQLGKAEERIAVLEIQFGQLISSGQSKDAKLLELNQRIFDALEERRRFEEKAGSALERLAAERQARLHAENAAALSRQLLSKEEAERRKLEAKVAELEEVAIKAAESAAETPKAPESEERQDVYREIADVSRLLQECEGALNRARDEGNWFRDLARVLTNEISKINGVAPVTQLRKTVTRKLAADKIFDANAYLRRYPDVREAGENALRHYLFHGREEGRLK